MYSHLNGVEPSHVHLEEPVLPVDSGDPGVVDAPRDVLERDPILQEAVPLVVDAERAALRLLGNGNGDGNSNQACTAFKLC